MVHNNKNNSNEHDTDPDGQFDSTLHLAANQKIPDQIGPYRILELLGSGGMGNVYLAEQKDDIQRKVALKVIKEGMNTREVIARFESERQALAMMNHQSVAKIYAADSTENGQPYFVMEHVPGEPITTYCDRHKLDIRDRLELFVPVCQAIHHAHQNGIIHRDIKPSNVLVSHQDGEPIPKVIDFGVAKAIQRSLTEKTIYTEQGRIIGTPAYMSPEQAEMTGLNITTTSDVYSLGVLLYELIVGALPFEKEELLQAGMLEMHRIIRDVDPPKPTTRIGMMGKLAASKAMQRRAEPKTWVKSIRGDVEWITMKAMDKGQSRRYSSPLELAADIQRHLRSEPVLAGPVSLSYQLRQAIRRNQGVVWAAGLILSVLVLGLIGTTYGLVRVQRARTTAIQAEERAVTAAENSRIEAEYSSRLTGLLTNSISSADPDHGGMSYETARKILDDNLELIENDLADYPVPRAKLMVTIGKIYTSLGSTDKG